MSGRWPQAEAGHRPFIDAVHCPHLGRKVDSEDKCGNCRAYDDEGVEKGKPGINCKPPVCVADSEYKATLFDCGKCKITCDRRRWLEWIQKHTPS